MSALYYHVAAGTGPYCYVTRSVPRPAHGLAFAVPCSRIAARKCNVSHVPQGRAILRRGRTNCVRAGPSDSPGQPKENEAALVTLGGGLALTVAATLALTLSQNILSSGEGADYEPFFVSSVAGAGDALGAALWAASLFFASPLQLLLLFLGRIDTERPSDWTLRILGGVFDSDNQSSNDSQGPSEPPKALLALNGALYGAAGVVTAALIDNSLGGEATWSVSTGIGACLAAGVYELGRPPRLTAGQQAALEAQWVMFRAFAEARLERKGRCHVSEVESALREFYPDISRQQRARAAAAAAGPARVAGAAGGGNKDAARRLGLALPAPAAEAAGPADAAAAAAGGGVDMGGFFEEKELREMIANWHPAADRTSGGFYKSMSVVPLSKSR